MKKKKDSKQIILSIFLLFYVLSVFLDLHVVYNSISTLIRMIILGIFFIIVFFKYSTENDRKKLYLYLIFFTIYLIFHLININNNVVLLEILYLFKMLMNVVVIYTVYSLGINLKNFYKIIDILLLIICGQIVICNIFKVGYEAATYNSIKYNFLNWFSKDLYYPDNITGKGFFSLANQIVAIVLLYLPILLAKIKEKANILSVFTLFVTLFAMLILGNRSSTFGTLIILILAFAIYIFLLIIKKEEFKGIFFVSMIFFVGLYVCVLIVSPGVRRVKYYKDVLNDNLQGYIFANDEITFEDESGKRHEVIIRHDNVTIMDELSKSTIHPEFYEQIYPYGGDPVFWASLIDYDDEVLIDSRFVERKIVQRLKEVNNNEFFDSLLGLGYNKVINVVNIEKDYVMQYYSIGILGTILFLGVYIIIYIKLAFKLIFNFEKMVNFANVMLMLALGLVLVIAYYSGNLLNSISLILPISVVMGIAYNEIGKRNKRNVLGYAFNNYSKKEIVENLKEEIKNKKQNIIFNLNPIIMMNFYKNKKIIEEFNKQKYNIVDGVGSLIAARIKDNDVKRIPGIELMEELLLLAQKEGYSIYLYGAKETSLKKCQKEIEKKYKGINIVGSASGYGDSKEALKDINLKKPDILFVAMGSPKQEMFILNNKDNIKSTYVIMPVGGSFDVIGGNKKRAPKIIRFFRLEWLYRMIKEPRRMKDINKMLKFIMLVIFKNSCYNK